MATDPMEEIELHSSMTKADLDTYLERCGATEPNQFSVEDIFGAVDGALWNEVIVPGLAFSVDSSAVTKVRLAIDRARKKSNKKQRIQQQAPPAREKDEGVTAAVEKHKQACKEAKVAAPFLSAGRTVDAQGNSVQAFSFGMLDGKGNKAKAEDKLDPNVLRVSKPEAADGWQFRSDSAWAYSNMDKIAAFLGDQKKGEDGKLIPCTYRHEKARMDKKHADKVGAYTHTHMPMHMHMPHAHTCTCTNTRDDCSNHSDIAGHPLPCSGA